MIRTETERQLTRLEQELLAEVSASVSEPELRHALQQALRDLAGSVSRDSLPEMAARLVTTRLYARGPKIPAAV